MILTPLLLAACGDDAETSAADATPAAAAPSQTQAAAAPSTPADGTPSVPLRLTPEGLLGYPAAAPGAPPPPAGPPPTSTTAAAPPQEPPEDTPPSEAEVRGLYEGIMFTYAFDACGLPLIGEAARKDIEQRIEICPNPPLRKDAFRTVYHRAIEVAEQDPDKMRASDGRACPDRREFLRRVMSHAGELTFDDARPTDCGLLSPAPPGPAPATPPADASATPGAQKPF